MSCFQLGHRDITLGLFASRAPIRDDLYQTPIIVPIYSDEHVRINI